MNDIREAAAAQLSPENLAKGEQRDGVIIRTSVIGIVVNALLAAFKAAVGVLSNSIAIVLDAVNNLSDAGSSIITIIGTKLAARDPDRKHPWGYGRIEYLTSMIISVIVLYAGVTALVESVKKIISPETPDYSAVTLIIVAVGVAAKIVLGTYVKRTGKKVNSGALVNSGADALNDSIISAATLVAALIYVFSGLSLEPYLGAIISAVIVKSGVEMLAEAISKVLGERVDVETARAVRKAVDAFDGVHGSYDLIFDDYGSDKLAASIHIEVQDTMTAKEIDVLVRRITVEVFQKTGVLLTAIGIYSMNTQDEEVIRKRNAVGEIVFRHEHVLQMHGFYVNEEIHTMQFDIIIDFDEKDRIGLYQKIVAEVRERFPDYEVYVSLDRDFSLSE